MSGRTRPALRVCRALVSLLALALVLGACGGDGSGGQPDVAVLGDAAVSLDSEVSGASGTDAGADTRVGPVADARDAEVPDAERAGGDLSGPDLADVEPPGPDLWAGGPDSFGDEGSGAPDGVLPADAPGPGEDPHGGARDVGAEAEPCGDGACEVALESASTCPEDCGSPATPAALCLVGACPAPMAICQADPGCNGVFLCLLGCPDDVCAAACYDGVAGGSVALMVEALACAQDAACFGGAGSCGDGTCASEEDAVGCPEDCGVDPGCLDAACAEPLEACLADPGCALLRDCAVACTTDACEDGCYLGAPPISIAKMVALTACAEGAGCVAPDFVCGDGFCEAGEDPAGCPEDCSVTCGDGSCDVGETAETCPEDCSTATCMGKCGQFDEGFACQCDAQCPDFGDCCDDYFSLCADEPVCGDGACDAGEDAASCPGDCETGLDILAGQLDECLAAACLMPVTDCLGQEDCAALASCIDGCDGVQFCAVQCWREADQHAQQLLAPILECGVASACLVIDDLPVCGDGLCEPGELSPWCAGECDGGAGCDGLCGELQGALAEVEACVTKDCGEPVAACAGVAECAALGQCLATCQGVQLCAIACYGAASAPATKPFDEVLACAASQGCVVTGGPVCGDGVCDGGESVDTCYDDCFVPEPGSCADACFTAFVPGADCQCDPFCLNYDDCCADYSELCLPPCGNGTCDIDESPQSCPSDCAPGWECLQAACSTAICEQVPACSGMLSCLAECTELPCAQTCAAGLGGIAAAQFTTVLTCGAGAGCLIVPGECGNGVCEQGPGDGAGDGPGDGAAPETADSCPADCLVADPLCLPQECGLNDCFDADGCNALLPCVAPCATEECAAACVTDPLDEASDAAWQGVLECSLGAGCWQ